MICANMGEHDIDTLLQNGYWPNSRARSPESRSFDSPRQSSYSSQDDRFAPRKLAWNGRQRQETLYPPPPSVEDESDALAKEVGSVLSAVPNEEPVHRGDPDQYPIIQPVHEFNPERRFVIVSNMSDSDGSGSESKQSQRRDSRGQQTEPESPLYEANTGRKKCGLKPSHEGKTNGIPEMRPERENRRSRHEDLPPIITDGGSEGRPQDNRRAKSTTRATVDGEDYFSSRLSSASSRHQREGFLTPQVTEHATNGRDRSYYKGTSNQDPQTRSRSAHPNDQRDGRNHANERKYKEREPKPAHPTSPPLRKRHTSEAPKYTRRGSQESHDPLLRQSVEASSSKPDRKAPSSSSNSDRDAASQRSSTTRERRTSPQRNDTFYSSEDETRTHADPRRRRQAMPAAKTGYLNTPVEPKSRNPARRNSRGPSPLPSPRLSHNSLSDPHSSSSSTRSTTFPREVKGPRDEDRSDRPLARASTARASFNASRNSIPMAGAATAAAMASTPKPSTSVDPRRSAAPPLPRSSSAIDPRPSPPIPTVSVQTQPTWPPPRFEPPPPSINSNPSIRSYRRFSLEVKNGELPDIPQCPRTRPEAGHMDWLTLPRCDNFNICPSCYSANFASTEFAHHFVPVPFRPRDRALACDLGTSEYFRIAWLFTRKYRRADLALLHGLIRVGAACPPCPGAREASRIWYSIQDPRQRGVVDDFTVCHACAKTVETLLPSLTGLFVPLDSPAEPRRGVCALHQENLNGGGRFLLYFDVLENAADGAFEAQSAPDVRGLADRIRELAALLPCPRDQTLRNASWYTMRSIPQLTVCPECFFLVVRPLLEDRGQENDLSVVGDFHHGPARVPEAECMLFSERMRGVFERAVAKRDLGYLRDKVWERAVKERECEERRMALMRVPPGTGWAKAEMDRIVREWKRFE